MAQSSMTILRTRTALFFGALALVLAFALALPTFHLGSLLLVQVERPYASPGLANRTVPAAGNVDGVIVLGGGFEWLSGRGPSARYTNPRVEAAAALLKADPGLSAVLAGGGIIAWTDLLEADMAEQMLRGQYGLGNPILKEDRSTTTYENALYSLGFTTGRRWLLVTSPSHMTRALGTFRSLGVCVWPAPSKGEFAAGFPDGVEFGREIYNLKLALHEVVGIVVYALRGRFSSSSPCPPART